MNPNPELDRIFPLSSGSAERARLRAPRLFLGTRPLPSIVMGNRAFMRTWAARRIARQLAQSTDGCPQTVSG